MTMRLVFVYNADSGLFNTLTDIAHKVFAPQTYSCRLCALTHSYFTIREEWKRFIEGLGAECEFLHRDQFRERHPGLDIPLPAILRDTGDGLRPCLDAAAIGQCRSIGELKRLIVADCADRSA